MGLHPIDEDSDAENVLCPSGPSEKQLPTKPSSTFQKKRQENKAKLPNSIKPRSSEKKFVDQKGAESIRQSAESMPFKQQ